jgi:hypothetical protein
MKVYRKLVLSMATQEVLHEDSYEYNEGDIAQCKGGGSSTTTSEPWEGQKPYLSDVYTQAQAQHGQPISYYPGETTAGFTPQQQLAMNLTENRALMGSPLVSGAQGVMYNTLQGSYMNPESNPWLSATYQKGAQDIVNQFQQATMPEIRRQAFGAGAYGGSRQGIAEGLAGQGLATSLQNLATDIYGRNYLTERGYQQQAMTQAPALAEADYADIAKLAAVGEEQQAMEQALIDEAKKRWEFYQQEPWQRLGMYSNLITGNVGGTSMTSGGGK